jgi:hypothetical protein
VGKKSSIALSVVGVVLIVVAIVWWTAIEPALTKLPSDVDTRMDFEGKLTLYVDPETEQPLAAGQEIPITVLRTFKSIPDLYTSGTAVFEDSLVLTVAGQEQAPQVARYALDRKTRKCVESDENWAYSPQIVLPGRVGYYGPLFPGGLEVGDTVTAFFNDPAQPFDVTVAEKIEDYNGLGITALKIDATRPTTPYDPTIAQAVLVQGQGLPTEISFTQFSTQLKAAGLDLDALLGALLPVATPEDLQALQTMTQQPIQLVYSQNSGDVIYIEQKTGATVGATFDRTTTMSPDPSGLMGALTIVGNYASDPAIGPAITAAMQAATQLSQAEPIKVFNQNMTIIPSSEADLAASAKDKIPLLAWAKLGIPLIVVIIGALVLAGGCYLILRTRKPAATPAPATKAPAAKAPTKKAPAKKPPTKK